MSAGDVLIVIGAMTSVGAAVTRYLSVGQPQRAYISLSRVFSLSTFVAMSASLLLLVYSFLTSDMSYYYVWRNSSTDLGGLYKLSGVWAGAQGSFLL